MGDEIGGARRPSPPYDWIGWGTKGEKERAGEEDMELTSGSYNSFFYFFITYMWSRVYMSVSLTTLNLSHQQKLLHKPLKEFICTSFLKKLEEAIYPIL